MNQANVYWRHNYDFGGQTMAYVGGVDSADVGSWLVGVLGQAPLSDTISLYSNVTFAFPGSKNRSGRRERAGMEPGSGPDVFVRREGREPDRLGSERLASAARGQQWFALDHQLATT